MVGPSFCPCWRGSSVSSERHIAAPLGTTCRKSGIFIINWIKAIRISQTVFRTDNTTSINVDYNNCGYEEFNSI